MQFPYECKVKLKLPEGHYMPDVPYTKKHRAGLGDKLDDKLCSNIIFYTLFRYELNKCKYLNIKFSYFPILCPYSAY
jgi:hypothetical protein